MQNPTLRNALIGSTLAASGPLWRPCAMTMLVASTLCALTAPVATHAQQAPAPATSAWHIPAQPLVSALRSFASQGQQQLLFDEDRLEPLRSHGVNGHYTPQEALNQLLAGTGIVAVQSSPGFFTLRDAPRPASGADHQLPEVVVSASSYPDVTSEGTGSYAARGASIYKGARTLREIPQSISVVTRQQIEDQNLTTTAEALNRTTGVSLDGYDGQESPQVRGFNTNVQADGVSIQSGYQGTGNNTLVQYDRIEVLRGPSALLSGTGEPGGTVNYVRKRPSRTFAMSGSLRAGSWNRYGADLDVGGPIAAQGRLRGRAVIYHESQDKFYHVASDRYSLFYGALEYDLSPATTLGINATYGKRDWTVNWGLPRYTDGSLPGRRAFMGSDRNSSHGAPEFSADLTHEFGQGWQARVAYNYGRTDITQYSFFNAPLDEKTGLGSGETGYLDETRRFDSIDTHITGPFSLFGQTHELTLGYNATQRDYRSSQNYLSTNSHDPLNEHHYAFGLPSSGNRTKTHQSGVYASARLRPTDTLTLILGARWTDYRSKSRKVWPTTTAWNVSNAKANHEFTPYGGVVWDFLPEVSWYASYADTFVPQTQLDVIGKVIDPRKGWQVETGLKGEFYDGRLNASVAVYRIRDTNRALLDNEHFGCGGTASGACYINAGEVESQGWEAELAGSPLPGWDVLAGYTFNRSKYLRDSNINNVGALFNSRTPKHLLKLWSQYRLGDWTVGAGAHIQSQTASGVYRQGGYATVSAKLGWQASRQWNLGLQVDNLFDRTYLRQLGSAGFSNFYGAPRSVLLTARWTY